MTSIDRNGITSSFCPFSGLTNGGRKKRSNARRGGCSIPSWPSGSRT